MQSKSADKEYERIDMLILTEEIERALSECELVESRDEIRARHEAICKKLSKYREGWRAIGRGSMPVLDFDGRTSPSQNHDRQLVFNGSLPTQSGPGLSYGFGS